MGTDDVVEFCSTAGGENSRGPGAGAELHSAKECLVSVGEALVECSGFESFTSGDGGAEELDCVGSGDFLDAFTSDVLDGSKDFALREVDLEIDFVTPLLDESNSLFSSFGRGGHDGGVIHVGEASNAVDCVELVEERLDAEAEESGASCRALAAAALREDDFAVEGASTELGGFGVFVEEGATEIAEFLDLLPHRLAGGAVEGIGEVDCDDAASAVFRSNLLLNKLANFVNNEFSATRGSNTVLRVLENFLEIFRVVLQGILAGNLGEDFAEGDWTDLAIWFGECNESASVDAFHDFFANGAVNKILNHFGEDVGTRLVTTNSIVQEFFSPASITRGSTTTGFLESLLERKRINLETRKVTFSFRRVGASSTVFALSRESADWRFTGRMESLKFRSDLVLGAERLNSVLNFGS